MPYISRLTLPSNETYNLKDLRLDNYGICSTIAGTTIKQVTINNDYFTLEEGVIVTVKFTITNEASNPTLKVNSTNAKPIYYKGSAIQSGYLQAGKIYSFIYNGTQYQIIGDIDPNATAATAAPGKVASTSSTGTSINYARQDHTHGIDLATGDSDGQVKIAGSNVSVKGLGSAAYTNSTAYLGSGLKGTANGVAQLDSNGLVPTSQLPSYVDDVLEYDKLINFPVTGQTGKIYVDTTTNKTYRWSGTTYVEISASLALGTTSQTAYRGDYGNTAYTHATDSSRLTTATNSGLYKVAATAQGHIASLTAVTKDDITALGIPEQDTNTTYAASTVSIGSASTGTAIPADDITAWTTNTPTAVTPATVVTSASGATASVSNGVLSITNGSFGTGPAATVTAGTAASLSYTAKSIPNISVTSKNVVTGITAN